MHLPKPMKYTTLYDLVGANIPLLSMSEMQVYGFLSEKLENNESLILCLDEIFAECTYSKKQRFLIVSQLIKKQVISRERVSECLYKFSLLCNPFNECKEIKVCVKNK